MFAAHAYPSMKLDDNQIYASPKYQRDFGGAYILVPLANEYRDEFHSFKEEVEPRLPRLQKMKHCFIYTPEWVRNSDGGIASINVGIEMGQHCLVNSIHANLVLDDGTAMDERLPRGITGWLSDYFHKNERNIQHADKNKKMGK